MKNKIAQRPFTNVEECISETYKHTPFGLLKTIKGKEYYQILGVNRIGCTTTFINTIGTLCYRDAFNTFLYADGTPFGYVEYGI